MNQGQPVVYNYGAPPPLPPGWAEGRTPTGQPYWYNSTTGQSSWMYPVFQQPIAAAAAPPPQKKKQIKKKIPGTHWLFVVTFDGYEFFYDRETKTSVWEMPEDLKEPMELLKKQEEEEKENKKRALEEEQEQEVKRIKLEQEERQKKQKEEEEEKKAKEEEEETTELTEEDFMWQLQQMEQEQEAEEEEEAVEEMKPTEDEERVVQLEEQVVEEEQEPVTEEVVVQEEPKKVPVLDEEVTRRFYELLKERNISPFSVYSMEYPKLMTDPRFEMVPQNKQKVLFNKYCNELSEKIKNEKKNKKKPEDEFKELLDQAVTEKMYWDDFRRKYKNDPRFKAIPVTKEKEALFKDHVKQLGTNRKNPTEDYIDLLSSTKEIRVGIRWRDAKKVLEKDPRYHAIESFCFAARI